jgi:hypothetical protein
MTLISGRPSLALALVHAAVVLIQQVQVGKDQVDPVIRIQQRKSLVDRIYVITV